MEAINNRNRRPIQIDLLFFYGVSTWSADSWMNEIKISLFQDFTALRFVTVVYNTEMEELEALEQ